MPIINSVIQGGGTTPTLAMVFTKNNNNVLTGPTTVINLDGVTDISSACLKDLYKNKKTMNDSASFNTITQLTTTESMRSMFQQSEGVISFSMDNVVLISGNFSMQDFFRDAKTLSSVSMKKLETVSGNEALSYAFSATPITSFDFTNLKELTGPNCMQIIFYNCTNLTSGNFPSLNKITGSQALYFAFGGCTALTSLSFPALKSDSFGSNTNQFNSMLYGVTGCTVHFPSNLQSVIGSWSDVTAGFGGTNTTILYDLPATE